ncbi:hypothetical protein [Acanthopleuribacter pedis]|uniref:Uncharacterized protein n=1 Tax=Acanthopleuribacter pedis TaxID=442870 RepID=A0A8J7U7D0_9BACT|nr:hypothetical protein [Acanthopleuribacter pedis]MBO1321276.1 hypothetical protein [Acanthopleuribacter pedis]
MLYLSGKKMVALALLLGVLPLFAAGPQGNADEKSAALAAKTMAAMGGAENYNNTRFLSWNFFGSRQHYWDKWTGRVRIEDLKNNMLVLMNVNTKEGEIFENGEKVTDEAKQKEYLQKGYEWWINDSYWLVMPYKLRDPGVTLAYEGEGKTEAGQDADVIAMTFESVGVTPQNKYKVYIGKDDNLIRQWDFFPTADAAEPRFKTPWDDWAQHGTIQLSGNRGKYSLADIKVHDQLADAVFTDPAPVQAM